MINSLTLIAGSFISKLIPLAFGIFLVNYYGAASYSLFLQLIVFSNFLVVLSTVSYTPIILSSQNTTHVKNKLCHQAMNFSMLVATLGSGVFLFTHLDNTNNAIELISSMLFVSLYSFGLSLTHITVAKFNSESNHGLAGIIISISIIIPYLATIILSKWFSHQLSINYLFLSILVLLFGLFFFKKYISLSNRTFYYLKESLPKSSSHIYLLIFSGGIMFSHYYLLNTANSPRVLSEASLTLGVGLQLFSIIIFLPGTLANIIIPRLSKNKSSNDFKVLFLLYFIIAVSLSSFIYMFLDYIFGYYTIESNKDNKLIILLILFSAILASVSALLFQYLTSYKKYSVMAFSSVVFLFVILLFSKYYAESIVSLSYTFLTAYIVAFIINLTGFLFHSRSHSKVS